MPITTPPVSLLVSLVIKHLGKFCNPSLHSFRSDFGEVGGYQTLLIIAGHQEVYTTAEWVRKPFSAAQLKLRDATLKGSNYDETWLMSKACHMSSILFGATMVPNIE